MDSRRRNPRSEKIIARAQCDLSRPAEDETLGCGGLIQRLVRRQWKRRRGHHVRRYTHCPRCSSRQSRGCGNGCKILGFKKALVFLGFADQKFDTYPMADLANAVMELRLEPT